MGIKIKYEIFENRNFQAALARLAQFPFRDQKVAYNIARFCRKFENEMKTAQDLWIKLLKQFAELEEDGRFKPVEIKQEDGTIVKDATRYTIIESKREEFPKAKEEFNNLEFEIPSYPIKIADLAAVELSPAELMALEPILEMKLLEDYPSEVSASA